MCVDLSVQLAKFQVSELVRENMWKRLGNACTKNMSGTMQEEKGKNCPFGN